MTMQQRSTFDVWARNLLLVLITSMMGWLCKTTLEMSTQVTTLVANSASSQRDTESIRAEIAGLHGTDVQIEGQIQALREQNIKHGW